VNAAPSSIAPWAAEEAHDTGAVDAERPVFARPSELSYAHESGVAWFGPWEDEADGTSIATRRYARALASGGVAVSVAAGRGYVTDEHGARCLATEGMIAPAVRAEMRDLRETKLKTTSLLISHFVPTIDVARRILYPGQTLYRDAAVAAAMHKYRVALIVLERDRVSPQLASYLRRFAAVWVPCHANARALVRSGVPEDQIAVIPHPYPANHILRAVGETRTPPDAKAYVFYNIAKWEPRKNNHVLLGAFLRAFTPSDHAMMVVKTSAYGRWEGYPEGPAASLCQWLDEDEQVRANGWTKANVSGRLKITTARLSDDEIAQIHALGHCYVSPSHGEAWDMPAFDAVVARARLIHVGFGGSEDYAPASTIPIGFGMVPAHTGYGWGDACWAGCTIDPLVDAMRTAYAERRLGDPIDLDGFSYESVGNIMRTHIERILTKARQA